MITGVRLSQLAIGEPLLGVSWEYKTLTGKAAVVKRLEDLFYNAKYMGFNFVIDTIKPQLDAHGKLTLANNGVHGDVWTFQERMAKYKELCRSTEMTLLIEVEFPTNVNSSNVYEYATFFLDYMVGDYDWIKYWQIMVTPEEKDIQGNYKCSPTDYVKFMSNIYPKVKQYNSEIQIGGPGILQAAADYVNDRSGWFSEAIGELYGTSSKYTEIGDKGFLPYIDFFAFQGKQNTAGLNYINFTHAVTVLKESIYNRIGDNNIPFFSTSQGWKSDADDEQSLKQQGYYELREILNCVRSGVVPFKDELIDAYPDSDAYGGNFDSDRLHRGLFYWYLSGKPAMDEYLFILKALADYSDVTITSKVMDANDNLDSFTLTRTDSSGETTATIIWPKTFETETVTLLSAYNRQYQLANGEQRVLDEATQIVLQDSHFLIVYEKVQTTTIDVEDLEKLITRKLNYTEDTLANLLELLPTSYNKEVTDVNFYKLLRSLALEMGDAKVELDMIKDDLYLETARQQAIYDNFGILVNLKKKAEWDWDKYRRLVKGVTQSLLEGPTSKSIVNAIQLFTNFNVSITELYKEAANMDASLLEGINPQFAFIVEIEKPLEAKENQEGVYSDANYIINIVKPAHTISIIVVTLSGKENWQDEYKDKHGIAWKDMDSQPGSFDRESAHTVTEGIYGWRHLEYNGVMKTANGSVISNAPLTNGGMFIGPRYVLYDQEWSDANLTNFDTPNNKVIDTISILLDLDEKELYDKATANWSEFETTAEEFKFGFDTGHLLKMNGGPDKIRILNRFKLAYATKLADDVLFEPEYFFDDKYVFRNTLRSLQFGKHIGFGGKFVDPPDKTIIFDFEMPELTFRKKIIRLDDGTESIVDRLAVELAQVELDMQILYDTTNIGVKREVLFEQTFEEDDIMEEDSIVPWLRLNSPAFMEKKLAFKRFRAQYETELENYETFDSAEENQTSHGELLTREFYRPYELSDPIYHVHKRVTSIMQHGQDYITVDPHDLYLKGNDTEDSLCRVFINGVLQSGWSYKELISEFDSERAHGVRFLENVVFPGDIVSILYLNDRNIIIGNFPIDENETINFEDFPEDNYIVYEKADTHFELVLEGSHDFYKGAIEEAISALERLLDEVFHKVTDVPEFEGSPNDEHRDFTRRIEVVNRFTLNKSYINQAFFVMIPHDIGTVDLMPHENVDIPNMVKNFLDVRIAEHNFAELKVQINDSVEFSGPEYNEPNIAAQLSIIDHPSEFGMIPHEKWENKDDTGAITDAAALIKEARYEVKEDRPYQDYVTGDYKDTRDRSWTKDHTTEYGNEVYDKRVKDIVDYHVQSGEWLDLDKYKFYSNDPDHDSHAVIFAPYFDTFRSNLIQDHADNEFEVYDIRVNPLVDMTDVSFWDITDRESYDTKGIGISIETIPQAREDSRTMCSNIQTAFRFCGRGKIGSTKFLTKNVIDCEGYEMIPHEILDKTKIYPHQSEISNDLSEETYEPKNSELTSEYDKSHKDNYVLYKRMDTASKEYEDVNSDTYNVKAAICYLELTRYINGVIPQKIRNGSMT